MRWLQNSVTMIWSIAWWTLLHSVMIIGLCNQAQALVIHSIDCGEVKAPAGYSYRAGASDTTSHWLHYEKTIYKTKRDKQGYITLDTIKIGSVEVRDEHGNLLDSGKRYPHGTKMIIKATATKEGYRFVSFRNADSFVQVNPYEYILQGDLHLRCAIFPEPSPKTQIFIRAHQPPRSQGKLRVLDEFGRPITDLKEIRAGSKIQLKATPKDKYHFDHFKIVSDMPSLNLIAFHSNPAELNVHGFIEIFCTFKKKKKPKPKPSKPSFYVTYRISEGKGVLHVTDDKGTPIKAGEKYEQGTKLHIEALPDLGYEFQSFNLSSPMPSFEDYDVSTNPHVHTLNETLEIKCYFVPESAPPPPTLHTISYQSEYAEGSVRITDKQGQVLTSGNAYPHGTEVHIEATPKAGYEFDAFDINGSTISTNPHILTLEAPLEVKCSFVAVNTPPPSPTAHTISYQSKYAEGSVRVTDKQGQVLTSGKAYPHGIEVYIEATPKAGYEFDAFDVNGSTISTNPHILTLEAPLEVKCSFVSVNTPPPSPTTHTISYQSKYAEGSVRVTDKQGKRLVSNRAYPDGMELWIEAIPKKGYQVASLLLNGRAEYTNPCQYTLHAPLTVECTFTPAACQMVDELFCVETSTHTLQRATCPSDSLAITHPSIKRIGTGSIEGHKTLKALYIGSTVEEIDKEAFIHCPALERIYIANSSVQLKNRVFAHAGQLQQLHLLFDNADFTLPYYLFEKGSKQPLLVIVPIGTYAHYASLNSQRITVAEEHAQVRFTLASRSIAGDIIYTITSTKGEKQQLQHVSSPFTLNVPGGVHLTWNVPERSQAQLVQSRLEHQLIDPQKGFLVRHNTHIELLFVASAFSEQDEELLSPVERTPNSIPRVYHPCKGIIWLIKPYHAPLRYTLYSLLGTPIEKGILATGESRISITYSYPEGIYYLHLQGDNESAGYIIYLR